MENLAKSVEREPHPLMGKLADCLVTGGGCWPTVAWRPRGGVRVCTASPVPCTSKLLGRLALSRVAGRGQDKTREETSVASGEHGVRHANGELLVLIVGLEFGKLSRVPKSVPGADRRGRDGVCSLHDRWPWTGWWNERDVRGNSVAIDCTGMYATGRSAL